MYNEKVRGLKRGIGGNPKHFKGSRQFLTALFENIASGYPLALLAKRLVYLSLICGVNRKRRAGHEKERKSEKTDSKKGVA